MRSGFGSNQCHCVGAVSVDQCFSAAGPRAILLELITNLNVVEEWKSSLMSLAILFHFLCAQHVSDINISIIRRLRLCCWITTSVVLFSVRCVLEIRCGWFWVVLFCRLKPAKRAPNLQHTTNWEQDDRCGNSTQSQAPDDWYINRLTPNDPYMSHTAPLTS